MDSNYDEVNAVRALEERQAVELENERCEHISKLTKRKDWEKIVEVMKFDGPNCWRMIKSIRPDGVNEGKVEEYQVHVVGILEDKRLPPIRGDKQSVTLGGFQCSQFMEDIEHIMDVVALFSRHVPGIQQAFIKQVGDKTMIEVGNRIFTPRNEAPTMQPATVDRLMDENGFIQQVNKTGTGFVYGEENVVYYGEEITDDDGTNSVVGIGKGRDMKARLVLRNVTLLDSTYTQLWLKTKVKGQLRLGGAARPVLAGRKRPGDEYGEAMRKRHILDPDTDGATKRLTEMALDE
ncbi:hypothetical protein EV361DRAFT_1019152 [Lentinula raphanica]|nr:hypothetical protein F5880DRAFT_1512537 [Lentinula raphanica]KAJ3965508.1 hypothetical protein EV361DRAFT_1019152 [Lentinula raphanica]